MNPETVKQHRGLPQAHPQPGHRADGPPARHRQRRSPRSPGEHLGLVYLIEDEGETSYQLEMTILQEDLEG
jgi:hypothetical protein